ncbi:hypothetical protein ACFQ3W_15070 [Paenibacillus puldeungensis]|uniref:Bacterial Pleckstrin homology domain-containing protein n=1 Tax=Paenibacillus puldeungensis TaxID=696536 RepID=A0ABW3RZE8_9BACL
MDNEGYNKIRRKYIMFWIALCILIPITLLFVITKDWTGTLFTGAFDALIILAIISSRSMLMRTIAPFQPGKGYWYYRMSPQSKRVYFTVTQWTLFLIVLLYWMSGHHSWYAAVGGLFSIYYIQVMLKRRIQLHTEVDDASLFELEELGIIEPEESVISLYKDFLSWSEVPENAKILILTPDRLVVIRMTTPEEGERYEIRLRDIFGLKFVDTGRHGGGKLVALLMNDQTLIHLDVAGESNQDSPEQFFSSLLKTLDQVKMNPGAVPEQTGKAMRNKPAEPSFNEGAPRPVIRHLDLANYTPSNYPDTVQDQSRPSGAIEVAQERGQMVTPDTTNRRKIDF